MRQLLVLCDNGGGNGAPIPISGSIVSMNDWRSATGCRSPSANYPPGASKWNPIDHRLFSFISLNWAGVPLESYQLILN